MKLSAPEAFALYGALSLQKETPLGFLSAVSKMKWSTANSMLAVRDTYRHLELAGKEESAVAARTVYGGASCFPFENTEISARIRAFASDNFMDDRTVYRRLTEAKKIYEKMLSHYELLAEKN